MSYDYAIRIEVQTDEIIGYSGHHYKDRPVYKREETTIEGRIE